MLHKNLVLTVLMSVVGCGTARADLILSFTPDGSSTTFVANQGGTVQVPVYIVERNQAPLTSILSTEGLFFAGVGLSFSTNPGNATVTSAILNPSFGTNTSGFPQINNPGGIAGVSGGTANPAGVPTTGSPPSILVGTFTFQAGVTVGNVTTIGTRKPQSASFPEFVSNTTGTVLETQPYANIFYALGVTTTPVTYFTTVTVVPEPSSLVLLSMPLVASFLAWRRGTRTVALLPNC